MTSWVEVVVGACIRNSHEHRANTLQFVDVCNMPWALTLQDIPCVQALLCFRTSLSLAFGLVQCHWRLLGGNCWMFFFTSHGKRWANTKTWLYTLIIISLHTFMLFAPLSPPLFLVTFILQYTVTLQVFRALGLSWILDTWSSRSKRLGS